MVGFELDDLDELAFEVEGRVLDHGGGGELAVEGLEDLGLVDPVAGMEAAVIDRWRHVGGGDVDGEALVGDDAGVGVVGAAQGHGDHGGLEVDDPAEGHGEEVGLAVNVGADQHRGHGEEEGFGGEFGFGHGLVLSER